MQYQVEDRIFTNEAGNQIKYKRLVITGYTDDGVETIELPISKDQATIYRLMSRSAKPEQGSRHANAAEQSEFGEQIQVKNNSSFLDD